MNNEYSQERDRVNAKAGLICCSVFFLGLLFGGLILIFYPNDILCSYTDNNLLCEKITCNTGYWGEQCLKCKDCLKGKCSGSGSKKGNGECICEKGWEGSLCDQCSEGYWGPNCTKCSTCNNGVCNGSNTHLGNGKCICNEPFTGENCNLCMPNYYGLSCKYRCNNTFCLNGECKTNSINKCKSCPVGYTGKKCEKCESAYIRVGNKCLRNSNLTQICHLDRHGLSIIDDKFGDCNECPKDKYGIICSNNGNCIGRGTVFGSGKCNCKNGYVGKICDQKGKLVNNSLCPDRCSNNGNCLKYNNSYYCNCNNNFIGQNCSKCDVGFVFKNNSCIRCKENSGFWGKYCQKCSCINGNCNDGIRGNGTCNCKLGWTGPNCDLCMKDYFGKNCKKCLNCRFGVCDDGIKGNGKCYCDKGYKGELCDSCSKGFINNGYHCKECPGSLGGKRKNCNNNGKCEIKDGKAICKCFKGYKGKTCLEYSSSNCSHLDYCSNNGLCKNNNCFCKVNFFGENCNLTLGEYNKMNSTNFIVSSIEPEKIDKIKSNIINNRQGESIGLSIAIVFSFIGCLLGIVFLVKNKKKLKMKFTQQTATPKIELTADEKRYMNENPIFTLDDKSEKGVYFTKGLKLITEAVKLDNDHNYEEALNNYNKGIDQFMIFLKLEKNSQVRFSMAKRLDIYLRRTQILEKYTKDKSIIEILPEGPKAPIIKNDQ